MNPSPLAFARVLDRLRVLGAALVEEGGPEHVLMVYERDEGYYGLPRGKRYPLKVRPTAQAVPLLEIEKMLQHLEFSVDAFWAIDDGHLDALAPIRYPEPKTQPVLAGVFQAHAAMGCCPVCNSEMEAGVCPKCIPIQ